MRPALGKNAIVERIVVLGGFGQLGSEIISRLGRRSCALGHDTADVTDAQKLNEALTSAAPTVVINCAAYNQVDQAEAERETAYAVNAWGARNVADWCQHHQVPLMHISTDYVFGREATRIRPYTESDNAGPLSVYGTSKSVGECMVREHCPDSWVVRTCGLYGRRATKSKGHFVATMLRLGTERSELSVVDDQRCTPTNAGDLADALLALIQRGPYGVYHATNAGECSWYEFACEIFRLRRLTPKTIPITTEQYGARAPRPRYSVLDCQKLAEVVGQPLRSWQDALADYLAEVP